MFSTDSFEKKVFYTNSVFSLSLNRIKGLTQQWTQTDIPFSLSFKPFVIFYCYLFYSQFSLTLSFSSLYPFLERLISTCHLHIHLLKYILYCNYLDIIQGSVKTIFTSCLLNYGWDVAKSMNLSTLLVHKYNVL